MRTDFILNNIQKTDCGLEIGPSHNPTVLKRDGWNIEIVDHATADELRAKYGESSVAAVKDVNSIEDVDYVWQGGSLVDLVGKPGHYDYIIASHVIEHTTDFVTFLQACEQLLKPTGKLYLMNPDKRYCFDYFRPISTTGDILTAYTEKRDKHTAGKIFDHATSICTRGGSITWPIGDTSELAFIQSFDIALGQYTESLKQDRYMDAHNWMFTPASFRLIISDLQRLSLLRLSYVQDLASHGFEFFVVLSKSAPLIDTPRIELYKAVAQELENSTNTSLIISPFFKLRSTVIRLIRKVPKFEQCLKKLLK